MTRIAPLLMATLLVACGGSDETEAPATAPAEDGVSEAAEETSSDDTTSEWPKIGDGIPEMDESNTVTTESGLQIITLAEGDGASPAKGDMVAVHYHGWLCLLYTSPSPRDGLLSRMPSSA